MLTWEKVSAQQLTHKWSYASLKWMCVYVGPFLQTQSHICCLLDSCSHWSCLGKHRRRSQRCVGPNVLWARWCTSWTPSHTTYMASCSVLWLVLPPQSTALAFRGMGWWRPRCCPRRCRWCPLSTSPWVEPQWYSKNFAQNGGVICVFVYLLI